MENRNYVSDVIEKLVEEYMGLFDGDGCKDKSRADELLSQFDALKRISGFVGDEYLKLKTGVK